ncbi:unnamed protein product [Paramecium primaurelia]|uniref:Protein kinase domain-containing protein n=1 Tax=Paramecium primaurelia TaxID=5886 RepID=A0A8S1KU69_PARPR|nr:unnamed protein product [Paramecium primaurelia]
MLQKKQHQKTQSTELSSQALMNYLSTREALNARKSNSPTFQLEQKKSIGPQQSPLLKSNNSQPNLKISQQQNLRKIQQQNVLKSRGFMSPKIISQERINQKTQVKSNGNHMKTQPHSHQNSQTKIKSIENVLDEYTITSPKQLLQQDILKTLPFSASTKADQNLKQKAQQAIQEIKQKQSLDLLSRLNIQKTLAIQSAKNQSQQIPTLGPLEGQLKMHQKSNSAQFIETQKFQTHASSQPLIEFTPDKKKPTTTRKCQQDLMAIIIQYKSFKQKITIDISTNKISWLLDTIKQEIMNHFGNSCQPIIGIKTANISIPVDYILSKIERPLSLLSNCPMQPLIIEPVINIEQELKQSRVSLKDFEFIRCIGVGGFSKVYLVREKKTGQFYAMKLIEKKPIMQQNKQNIIQNERDIMFNLNHPFIVKMQYAFESRKYLVFVLEYCSGGELFYLLRKVKRMSEEEAFFYFAEICLGMKNLHDNNIIYRDIKPENILIDFDGHVRIADFGLSKPHMENQEVAYSFCGSPEYMAPEMLLKQGHTFQLDLYCLGALLYELTTGLPPFYSRNTDEIYQKILNQKLSFPPQLQMSQLLKDLLNNLLAKTPKKRIDNIDSLLKHPWMTQWSEKNLYKDFLMKKIDPPFKPDYFQFNFDEEEFGKGESEFLLQIKPLQLNLLENFPKEIFLKNFYYNQNENNFAESTGGTNLNIKLQEDLQQQGTQRQKSKRLNTFDDENTNYVNDQKVFILNQLRLQTENEIKRKSAL